ncbi:hypothetical protein PVAP13_6KG140654 [Panicum virgatum]|uniref:Uncharacterized protein n=1 Tax=Panicum virgatum TaxID=38727 RepID=A0A8T0RE64_PANVG|nr:hypothetical protein PVAP13_6KG140654 [Panicum virgatum]
MRTLAGIKSLTASPFKAHPCVCCPGFSMPKKLVKKA